MDFVQRNLINERNNLQIELAKAKLLIAELSEGRLGDAVAAVKVRVKQAFGGPSPKQIEQKKRDDEYWKAARALPPAPEDSRSWPIGSYSYPDSASGASRTKNEQAEYISSLENAVIALAEQLGVHPNDLLNELNVGGAMKQGYQDGGVMGAIKGAVRGIGVNMRQAGQAKDGINLGTTNQRLAGVARKAGENVRGAPRIFIPGIHGPIRDPNAIVRGQKTEDRVEGVAGTLAGQMAAKNGFALGLHIKESNLLNEGEKRNIRLQKALQKAGDNIRIGNTKLGAMDSHIRDVATTQGGSAGQAASNALYRQKGKTKSAVSQAIEKSTKLSAALDTSTNQVRNSRAARVARGSFSDSPNEQRQADRIRSIGNEPKERNWRAATSTDSLAAQGKLPAKKFGSPGDQRTNLSAMRSDAYDARLKHAKAQSDAARARNQANRPV